MAPVLVEPLAPVLAQVKKTADDGTTSTPLAPTKVSTPFTSGALESGSSAPFWKSYISSRPSPPESFFSQLTAYHRGPRNVAHDVGTGPGNIATRLLSYFAHAVGSDVNADALAAAPALVQDPDALPRLTFVRAPAEEVADAGVVPGEVGVGKTDMVVVSECMPLLDAPRALAAFRKLLRPGGTLAIYFYARPIFADAECDRLYDRAATSICRCLLPFKGTPGFPFHSRGAEVMGSWMDSVELGGEEWGDVKRFKWNADFPLLFNGKEGYDFEFGRVDRRGEGEETSEVIDRQFWSHSWGVEDVGRYLDSVFPNWQKRAGEQQQGEVQELLKELGDAMGGKRDVSFPVSLILATRK